MEELSIWSGSDETLPKMYALNLAGLGRSDTAARQAKLAVDLLAKDKFSGPAALEDLAKVYAWIGRHEEAIDILERLLKTIYEDPITPVSLELQPSWDSLRGNPRFQKLLEQRNR